MEIATIERLLVQTETRPEFPLQTISMTNYLEDIGSPNCRGKSDPFLCYFQIDIFFDVDVPRSKQFTSVVKETLIVLRQRYIH
jgi:hypothetical protein